MKSISKRLNLLFVSVVLVASGAVNYFSVKRAIWMHVWNAKSLGLAHACS